MELRTNNLSRIPRSSSYSFLIVFYDNYLFQIFTDVKHRRNFRSIIFSGLSHRYGIILREEKICIFSKEDFQTALRYQRKMHSALRMNHRTCVERFKIARFS